MGIVRWSQGWAGDSEGIRVSLAKRIIPLVLHRGHQMVKGRQFKSWRSVGNALQAAKIHGKRGVDELVLLNVAATPDGTGPDLEMVTKLTEDLFTPVTVGGGVRSTEDARTLLAAGADKICVCTAHFHTDVVEMIANAFGRQAIVVSIDVSDGRVMSDCGTKAWHMNPISFAKMCADDGAGEILLNDVDRDGMMEGYNLRCIEAVASAVDIPVVAAGGCGEPEHMLQAIQAGASGVAASSIFLFSDETPRTCAEYLAAAKQEVRL